MAIPQIPDLLRAVLAHSADVEAIPDTTPTGQGVFSYRDGWPVITEVELEAGGIAPDRKFFNEIYRLLSGHTFYTQSGNVYPWVGASESFPGLNYLRGAHVLGSDYQEYVAKKPSGPEIPAEGGGFVGPVNPVGDASGVWMPVFNISTVEKNGINRPDGVTIKVDETGKLTAAVSKYEIGEFYYFRHPTLKTGFQPAQGGVIANAATVFPDIWAYLQTTEGQKLCKTEAEWQAMSTAIWHTNADGSTVGWNGIGGVPYYAPNLGAGSLRMPDVRGMYPEAAGFDALGVGGVHGDKIRNIIAVHPGDSRDGFGALSGAVYSSYNPYLVSNTSGGSQFWMYPTSFDVSRIVPVGNANKPRAWGALACAYLGTPAS